MTKDEALHVAAQFLMKGMIAGDLDKERIDCLAYIHSAEEAKDYARMYHSLEKTKSVIEELQNALKQK